MKRVQLLTLVPVLARTACLCACLCALPAIADTMHKPAHGVIGVEEVHLDPDFWVSRLDDADRVVMMQQAIEEQNARLFKLDPSMHDLRELPAALPRKFVASLIEDLADPPSGEMFDEGGKSVSMRTLKGIAKNRNLDEIPATQATRYGLVVHRADLRTFPTNLRVFRASGNTDIDRFQESALFPGTPVVIAHESGDGEWWFVVSPRYTAWIEKQHVGEGTSAEVLGYVDKAPYRIITGATVNTVFNPEQAAISELQLDMSVRVPVFTGHSANSPVNGQHPYSAHVIELPVRADEGQLRLLPALLQKNSDTADDYLPMTRANIIRQGFKFLGERYGWGHSYNGRDCSGFVSEVFGSMGALMPRNTSAQSISPALQTRIFSAEDGQEARLHSVRSLRVGDLVFIPGHVMMVIGSIDGQPYVIHDTTGISYRSDEGEMARVSLNAVAVTPLLPLRVNKHETYVDRMTSIVKIVPDTSKEASPSL